MSESLVGGDMPGIVAGFTSRDGGISAAPFESMNLAVSSGDDPEHVRHNRELLLKAVGFSSGRMAIAGQVHGTRVGLVKEPGLIEQTDGLVTQTPGLLLGIVAADCAVVLVADTGAGCVGAAHAGWRGAAAGIVSELVHKISGLGCRTQNLRAYVSPCISQARFEVGQEVAEQFDARFVVVNPRTGKPHVDLGGSLRAELQGLGLAIEHIEVDGRCTFDNPDTFYSYRAQKGVTGRMMGYIGIRTVG